MLSPRKRSFVLGAFLVFLAFQGLYFTGHFLSPEADNLNYFLEGNEQDLEYVINTSSCRILKFSPWDKTILPWLQENREPQDCSQFNYGKRWTYLKGQEIHINETAIKGDGYSLSSVKCCYKGILRVEQGLEDYDWKADRRVRFSDECTEMTHITKPKYEFVRILCSSTSWPYLWETVYKDYYAIPLPNGVDTLGKIEYWKKQGNTIKLEETRQSRMPFSPPPNVLMLGIDSLSRMNFHRTFPKTKEILERLGAIEMLGYTKVGENTYPNLIPIISGISLNELSEGEGCLKTPESISMDSCPFISNRFGEAKYLTAIVEDSPAFNSDLKVGFVKQPVDFYYRTMMLQVFKTMQAKVDIFTTSSDFECIGQYTMEEALLSYMSSILSISANTSSPVYIQSWLTSRLHGDVNGGKISDPYIASFLEGLDFSNTILFFISDHGQRYGGIRKTLPGWYEDKLPTLFIALPSNVREAYPEWVSALKTNSQRLSSPFDVYKTYENILTEFSRVGKETRKVGQSLFTELPFHRTCSDAGVPINYCACVPPRSIDINIPEVSQATKVALNYLIDSLPLDVCALPKLSKIVSAAVMGESNTSTGGKNLPVEGTLIVTFFTNPGNFMFEATVDYKTDITTGKKAYNISTELLRMNKMHGKTDCVITSVLQRYCSCKSIL